MIHTHKIENGKEKPLLLFSALDWGLGHITRSIPLIKTLQSRGFNIVVACNSIQKVLLEQEFNDLFFADLEGYNIRYSTDKTSTKLKLLLQTRNILTKIKEEKIWLDSFLAQNAVNAVISDNRYGLYSSKVHSILITHQLHVRSGLGKWADKILQYFLYKLINRFDECWVPDFEENGIAGTLSHPEKLPKIPVTYIGGLSRFEVAEKESRQEAVKFKYNLLVLLSGPEPQRTILENKIIRELETNTSSVILVRGLPGNRLQSTEKNRAHNFIETKKLNQISRLCVLDHARAEELNMIINQSELVICRPGYTTIMDMLKLGKKIISVPTPGQGEQEYLAEYLSGEKLIAVIDQDKFSMEEALRTGTIFDYQFREYNMELYKEATNNLFLRNASLTSF